MAYPTLTAAYAAVLALIFAVLSGLVIAGRGQFKAFHGDGGQERLNWRIRAHANFAEYVPLVLLVIALLEAAGVSRAAIQVLLLVLIAARIVHPIGMMARDGSAQQAVCRGGGAAATLLVLIVAAVMLLARMS